MDVSAYVRNREGIRKKVPANYGPEGTGRHYWILSVYTPLIG
jgi:hypothetical protein